MTLPSSPLSTIHYSNEMSSGPIPPPTSIIPFAAQQFQNTLSHLFPNSAANPFSIPCLSNSSSPVLATSVVNGNNSLANSHRIKMKRCRQRVDAGEPRNSYQSQMKSNCLRKETSVVRDGSPNSIHAENYGSDAKCFPDNFQPCSEQNNEDCEEDLMKVEDEQKLEDGDDDDQSIGDETNSEPNNQFPVYLSAELSQEIAEISGPSSSATSSSSSSRRKSFHPQRQSQKSHFCEELLLQQAKEEAHYGISASLQENKKNLDEEESEYKAAEQEEEEDDDQLSEGDQSTVNNNNNNEKMEDKQEEDGAAPHSSSGLDPTTDSCFASKFQSCQQVGNGLAGSPFQSNVKLQEIFEAHRRLYSTLLEQRKNVAVNKLESSEKSRMVTQQQAQTQDIQQNLTKMEQSLKDELVGAFSGTIDKVVGESFSNVIRIVEAMQLAYRQQQLAEFHQLQQQQIQQARAQAAAAFMNGSAASFAQGMVPTSSIQQHNYGSFFAAAQNHNSSALAAVAAAAAVANSHPTAAAPSTSLNGGGIFPTVGQLPSPFKAFNNSGFFPSAATTPLKNLSDDVGPRKKRSKVTDSVRGPRSSAVREESNSLPVSERSSPLLNSYFPPTMVSHPLYNSSTAFSNGVNSRDQSPGNNSDENNPDEYNDYGAFDGVCQQKYTLTHVHLRKAKLMFFYTRYPSSAVLKSYFPDIHFNKNNTAQLVKWFSNFREFFYMQMEKYAKQAIAEGIRSRQDITVRVDSEIYKQLNQHYNRNNVIQPPERLLFVIQETLKEFFVALQTGKDAEPSWKKVIYKVIQQMDEPIPDYFKDPNFIETLEQTS